MTFGGKSSANEPDRGRCFKKLRLRVMFSFVTEAAISA